MPATGTSGFFVGKGIALPAAPVVIQRPNVAGAHAAGDVWGEAGDARHVLMVPALPAESYNPGFLGLVINAVETVPASDGQHAFTFYFKHGAWTTAIADDAPFAVTDAEIALLYSGQTTIGAAFTFPIGAGIANALNASAGIAGRRGISSGLSPQGELFQGGDVVGLYVVAASILAPVSAANASMTLFPLWVYNGRGV
jgi:hypothetical protein